VRTSIGLISTAGRRWFHHYLNWRCYNCNLFFPRERQLGYRNITRKVGILLPTTTTICPTIYTLVSSDDIVCLVWHHWITKILDHSSTLNGCYATPAPRWFCIGWTQSTLVDYIYQITVIILMLRRYIYIYL